MVVVDGNKLVRSSFSQHSMFDGCQKRWWYFYVKKIRPLSDMCYANAGSILHSLCEKYYNNLDIPLDELKVYFEQSWSKYHLDSSKIKNKKDDYWLMFLNEKAFD